MERNWKLFVTGLTLGLVVIIQSGCAGSAKVTQPATQPAPIQTGAVKTAVKGTAPAEKIILEGKVAETINSGGYTYIQLEKEGKKGGWIALPPTQVAVGQEVKVLPGMEMGKFTSKTLNRTFENILFSSGLAADANAKASEGQQKQLPPGHPPMEKQSASDAKAQLKGHKGMMSQPGKEMVVLSGKVLETMDSGGYTYICLEKDGKKIWAAVPTTNVSVGQEIKLQPGMEMTNFKSSSLNRTFDSVIFSGGVIPAN